MMHAKEFYKDAMKKCEDGVSGYPCRKPCCPEVASLGWLVQNFPFVENPEDDSDRLFSCIFMYCFDAIKKIESLEDEIGLLKNLLEYKKE